MGYNLILRAEKGFISLEEVGGQVPEGTFEISGYRDHTNENLTISRRNADGTFAGSAGHSHPVTVDATEPEPVGGF